VGRPAVGRRVSPRRHSPGRPAQARAPAPLRPRRGAGRASAGGARGARQGPPLGRFSGLPSVFGSRVPRACGAPSLLAPQQVNRVPPRTRGSAAAPRLFGAASSTCTPVHTHTICGQAGACPRQRENRRCHEPRSRGNGTRRLVCFPLPFARLLRELTSKLPPPAALKPPEHWPSLPPGCNACTRRGSPHPAAHPERQVSPSCLPFQRGGPGTGKPSPGDSVPRPLNCSRPDWSLNPPSTKRPPIGGAPPAPLAWAGVCLFVACLPFFGCSHHKTIFLTYWAKL
jgi:hypothetical protein